MHNTAGSFQWKPNNETNKSKHRPLNLTEIKHSATVFLLSTLQTQNEYNHSLSLSPVFADENKC